MRKTQQLKNSLKGPGCLVVPGAYDGVSARLIERCGFEVVYMTGYGVAASALGLPDVGYATLTEMAGRAHMIAGCVDIPLIADADTGFGNAMNVRRSVREYERAGVAAIQLEDQVSPKRCGHMPGRQVIPLEEMVSKLKAAIEAREDPDFVIVARTDARTPHGLEEALRRAQAYRDAGADILFVESPETEEEMIEIGRKLKGTPLLSNQVEGGRTPLKTPAELEAMGFKIALYPAGSLFAATKAIDDYLRALRFSDGSARSFGNLYRFDQFNELIGLPEHAALEKRYLAPNQPL